MKKLAVILLIGWLLLFPKMANAQYYVNTQQPQPISQISIHKQVKNPQTQNFVDNMPVTDVHFLPGTEVVFRLQVTNNGQTDLNNIQVKDQLPGILDFVSGPGSFDQNSGTINIIVDKLSPQETKSYEFRTKVKPANKLNFTSGVSCFTNEAEARVNDLFAQAVAVFCVENKVLSVTTELPRTGPGEAEVVLLTSAVMLGLSGVLWGVSRKGSING